MKATTDELSATAQAYLRHVPTFRCAVGGGVKGLDDLTNDDLLQVLVASALSYGLLRDQTARPFTHRAKVLRDFKAMVGTATNTAQHGLLGRGIPQEVIERETLEGLNRMGGAL